MVRVVDLARELGRGRRRRVLAVAVVDGDDRERAVAIARRLVPAGRRDDLRPVRARRLGRTAGSVSVAVAERFFQTISGSWASESARASMTLNWTPGVPSVCLAGTVGTAQSTGAKLVPSGAVTVTRAPVSGVAP